MKIYTVNQTEICIEGITRTTYGLTGQTVEICDISPERQKVEALAEQCNRLDVSECHLCDIVEDFYGLPL